MKSVQFLLAIFCFIGTANISKAQLEPYQFGKGFRFSSLDSSFSIKAAFRFQSLFVGTTTLQKDDFSRMEPFNSSFLIRRARLKFDGHVYSQNIKYKFELGLSNRDNNTGDAQAFGDGANMILDAYFEWAFSKRFTVLVGQTKLPGNRERVISSANLQFVDRSLLNSRFNLDRDMGIQLSYDANLGKKAELILKLAISQGEGRDVTIGNLGGLEYTYRAELAPFGKFTSKGDYFGSDLAREKTPKLALGATFDVNDRAGRNRGNLGAFFIEDTLILKTLYTGFVDMIFKYNGFSLASEFAIRGTDGNDPNVYSKNGVVSGSYFTGSAFNVDVGYLFKNNIEIAGRYTTLRTQRNSVGNDENQYFIGFSKYIVGHSLKVQADLGYRQIEGNNDGLMGRIQFDFHL